MNQLRHITILREAVLYHRNVFHWLRTTQSSLVQCFTFKGCAAATSLQPAIPWTKGGTILLRSRISICRGRNRLHQKHLPNIAPHHLLLTIQDWETIYVHVEYEKHAFWRNNPFRINVTRKYIHNGIQSLSCALTALFFLQMYLVMY